MICTNGFCVYQKDDKCLLNEISINDSGCCQEAIYPDLTDGFLEYTKEKTRIQLEKDDNNYKYNNK